METPSNDIIALFKKAQQYEQLGDVYNATKLYRRIIKRFPLWSPPYFQLGTLYKKRLEWKPALHYNKKTVALDSGNKTAWWNMGIAATALKKWRISKRVWRKFGLEPDQITIKTPAAIRLPLGDQFEILWMQPLDPARGQILNIPHPGSGRAYRDIVLFDLGISGYNVLQNRRYPVYEELGIFKHSGYQTFSTILINTEPEDIQLLENLCKEAVLGFEVWSNASRVMIPKSQATLPEYYNLSSDETLLGGELLVAIAGRQEKEVLAVLQNWEIISLKKHTPLQHH